MDTQTMTIIGKAVNEVIKNNHGPYSAFLLTIIDADGDVNSMGHGNLRDLERLSNGEINALPYGLPNK